MDVICAYFTPKNLNFFDKFLIYFIKKISLVQSIIGATLIRGLSMVSTVCLSVIKNHTLNSQSDCNQAKGIHCTYLYGLNTIHWIGGRGRKC